jgi:hypothetical protein
MSRREIEEAATLDSGQARGTPLLAEIVRITLPSGRVLFDDTYPRAQAFRRTGTGDADGFSFTTSSEVPESHSN